MTPYPNFSFHIPGSVTVFDINDIKPGTKKKITVFDLKCNKPIGTFTRNDIIAKFT